MKVILLESMDNLGAVGEVINVRRGYARNFLLPGKKAIFADEKNLKVLAHQKMILDHKLKRIKEASEEIRKKVEKQKITITRKSGEKDKLFGSVTVMDIEHALKELGIKISRRSIHLDEPIKKVGKYQIPVKLDGGLEMKVTVDVQAEST